MAWADLPALPTPCPLSAPCPSTTKASRSPSTRRVRRAVPLRDPIPGPFARHVPDGLRERGGGAGGGAHVRRGRRPPDGAGSAGAGGVSVIPWAVVGADAGVAPPPPFLRACPPPHSPPPPVPSPLPRRRVLDDEPLLACSAAAVLPRGLLELLRLVRAALPARPRGRARGVLSNNDGCVVARSEEVKAMGVAMGAPFFKVRKRLEAEGVVVFSSNYALYADLSRRVMDCSPRSAPTSRSTASTRRSSRSRCRAQRTGARAADGAGGGDPGARAAVDGDPVRVAIAETKTLAKIGSGTRRCLGSGGTRPASRSGG